MAASAPSHCVSLPLATSLADAALASANSAAALAAIRGGYHVALAALAALAALSAAVTAVTAAVAAADVAASIWVVRRHGPNCHRHLWFWLLGVHQHRVVRRL